MKCLVGRILCRCSQVIELPAGLRNFNWPFNPDLEVSSVKSVSRKLADRVPDTLFKKFSVLQVAAPGN